MPCVLYNFNISRNSPEFILLHKKLQDAKEIHREKKVLVIGRQSNPIRR